MRDGNYGAYEEPIGCNFGYDDWVTYEADSGQTPIFTGIFAYGYCQPSPIEKLNTNTLVKARLIFRGITIYHGDVYIRELSYVQFYNCTFIGDGWDGVEDSYAISLHTVSDITIDSCTINGDGPGQGEGYSNGGIPKADFGKAYASGIRFQGLARNITINNCDIGSNNTGISAVHDSGIVISNNEIHHASDGITVYASNTTASGLSDPIVIENNHIHTLYEYGATLEEPNAGWHSDGIQFFDLEINHVVIRGNHIHNSDGDGMFLKGSKTSTGNTDWLIENNLVYDVLRPATSSETSASVMMYNCNDATFRNNTIVGKGKVEAAVEGNPPEPMKFAEFTNNIIQRINLGTDPGSHGTIVEYENNNIIGVVLEYGMGQFVFGPNTVFFFYANDPTVNFTAFENLFADYSSNDFRPLTSSIACNGSINPAGVPVGALPCLGCSNENPIAVFIMSEEDGYEPLEVQFDASSSLSCDTTITGYEWDFGDETTALEKTTSHTYTAGAYSPTLTVTNSLGKNNSIQKTITVLPSAVPNLNLYINFDNTVLDFSGKNNNGAWQGDESYAQGITDQAASLDGTAEGSYVLVNHSETLDGMDKLTLSIWAKKNNADIGEYLFHKYVTYMLNIGKDGFGSYIFDSSGNRTTVSSTNALINNTDWHHYALTYDGTNAKLYLDGQEIYSKPATGTIAVNSDRPVYIGKNPWGNSFNGSIDEAKIYDKALNGEEILALYESSKPECVNLPALTNYISEWKQGSFEIAALMQKIGQWKAGESC